MFSTHVFVFMNVLIFSVLFLRVLKSCLFLMAFVFFGLDEVLLKDEQAIVGDEWRRRCDEFVKCLRNVTKLFQLVAGIPNKVYASAVKLFIVFFFRFL